MKEKKYISKGFKLSCISIIFGLLLCGCSFGPGNGYVKFFKPAISQETVERLLANRHYPNTIKKMNFNENPQIIEELDVEYECTYIGESSFEGGLHPDNSPIEAASRIGANVYVNEVAYSRTVSGTYTTMMPTMSTTRTNSNASAYGSGGWASGSGSSTSTTYSSTPITQSYSADRYNQGALFYLCD